MLKHYAVGVLNGEVVAMPKFSVDAPAILGAQKMAWVRYEDAQAIELRIAELEQQLKTPEQKRAEFEEDCEREP